MIFYYNLQFINTKNVSQLQNIKTNFSLQPKLSNETLLWKLLNNSLAVT